MGSAVTGQPPYTLSLPIPHKDDIARSAAPMVGRSPPVPLAPLLRCGRQGLSTTSPLRGSQTDTLPLIAATTYLHTDSLYPSLQPPFTPGSQADHLFTYIPSAHRHPALTLPASQSVSIRPILPLLPHTNKIFAQKKPNNIKFCYFCVLN